MLDADVLAGLVVPAIGAAVSVFGVDVLTQAEDTAAEAVVRLGQRLLELIRGQAREPEPINDAIRALAMDHRNPDSLEALRSQIRKALDGDAELLAEVARMVPPRGELGQMAGLTVNIFRSKVWIGTPMNPLPPAPDRPQH